MHGKASETAHSLLSAIVLWPRNSASSSPSKSWTLTRCTPQGAADPPPHAERRSHDRPNEREEPRQLFQSQSHLHPRRRPLGQPPSILGMETSRAHRVSQRARYKRPPIRVAIRCWAATPQRIRTSTRRSARINDDLTGGFRCLRVTTLLRDTRASIADPSASVRIGCQHDFFDDAKSYG